jgi:hypothetical protein
MIETLAGILERSERLTQVWFGGETGVVNDLGDSSLNPTKDMMSGMDSGMDDSTYISRSAPLACEGLHR